MKRSIRLIMVVMVMLIVILSSTMVFAAPDPSVYNGNTSTINVDTVNSLGQNIVKVISTVGSIASVIVLIVLGIKYMMGSAEEKAEYKKTLMPYIIGAVFVFAASVIASAIFGVANSLLTT